MTFSRFDIESRIAQQYPERVHIVRAEDVLRDPKGTLGAVCEKLGLEPHDSLSSVSGSDAASSPLTSKVSAPGTAGGLNVRRSRNRKDVPAPSR